MISLPLKKGRRPHNRTESSIALVKELSSCGVPQEVISQRLGISKVTLHKHYRAELDEGESNAGESVVKSLFAMATTGNVAAAIFWAKCRLGWKEARPDTPSEHEARLLKTMRELRVNAGDVEAILRVMSLPPEQRGAALAVQERAKQLKGGAE